MAAGYEKTPKTSGISGVLQCRRVKLRLLYTNEARIARKNSHMGDICLQTGARGREWSIAGFRCRGKQSPICSYCLSSMFILLSQAITKSEPLPCRKQVRICCLSGLSHRLIYFFSLHATACTLIGFARWSFMPHSKHRCISSANASAVMAIMGISASSRSSARMAAVAS